MTKKHLTLSDRIIIQSGLQKKESLAAIARCNQRTPTDCFAEQNGRDAERAD